jgi:hypothetical protein
VPNAKSRCNQLKLGHPPIGRSKERVSEYALTRLIAFSSNRARLSWHYYFLSSAGQLVTSVSGCEDCKAFRLTITNFFPSGATS